MTSSTQSLVLGGSCLEGSWTISNSGMWGFYFPGRRLLYLLRVNVFTISDSKKLLFFEKCDRLFIFEAEQSFAVMTLTLHRELPLEVYMVTPVTVHTTQNIDNIFTTT